LAQTKQCTRKAQAEIFFIFLKKIEWLRFKDWRHKDSAWLLDKASIQLHYLKTHTRFVCFFKIWRGRSPYRIKIERIKVQITKDYRFRFVALHSMK